MLNWQQKSLLLIIVRTFAVSLFVCWYNLILTNYYLPRYSRTYISQYSQKNEHTASLVGGQQLIIRTYYYYYLL